jgi:cation diffusion facilitator CzcD-associated flavoprotein CzcO
MTITTAERSVSSDVRTVDAVVVGAGFSGLAMTRKLAELGLQIQAFDLGEDVGGTWYWNRYPGARTDSESAIYAFTDAPEVDATFSYTEKFPPQEQVLRYLNHVADTFDLRKHYEFGTKVVKAEFDDDTSMWVVTTSAGEVLRTRYLISGAGLLSEPIEPSINGLDEFAGVKIHTSRWPHEGFDFTGKRVALIGTGSSGIQVLPAIAEQADSVTVYQRTPNYVVPSVNHELDDDYLARLPQIRELARSLGLSMPYPSPGRMAMDVSEEERQKIFEEGWAAGGFRFLAETFDDLWTSPEANEAASEFLRSKIREIVKDPATAETLSPHYPYGVKRPPSGIEYFEAFNRDNVELVDLQVNPFVQATGSGISTQDAHRDFDVIVFATGFDVSTGPILRMNVVGSNGLELAQKWVDGPTTNLAVMTHGFPNLFMMVGPHCPGGNQPLVAQENAQWIAQLIDHAREQDAVSIDTTEEAEKAWVAHVEEVANMTVVPQGRDVHSWYVGSNIEGKPQSVIVYLGGANNYYDMCEQEAASGYPNFVIK